MKNLVYWHKEDSALDEKWCTMVLIRVNIQSLYKSMP